MKSWHSAFAIGLVAAASLLVVPPAAAQAGRFQIAGHAGVLDDGRGLLGAQIGVAVNPRWTIAMAGTSVRGVGPVSLTNWEAGVRWTPRPGPVRPYLLLAAALERASAGATARTDLGFTFGGGVEAGRGLVRPFVEARGFKDGSVAGFFWAGLRLWLGR